jgi:hypothetical protein
MASRHLCNTFLKLKAINNLKEYNDYIIDENILKRITILSPIIKIATE